MENTGKTMFGHPLARVFMDNIEKLNQDDFNAIKAGKRQLSDLEYYKKNDVSGASSRKDLNAQADTQLDGVNSFPLSRIPKGGSIAVGSIFIGHAFHTAASAPAGLFYNNVIPFFATNSNAAAGTASTIITQRDVSSSTLRMPEELLSAEFILKVDGNEIFKKSVRKMMFDSRFQHIVNVNEGYQLKKPIFIKEDALVEAQLLFPASTTVPGGSASVYHYFEYSLIGVGFKVKA